MASGDAAAAVSSAKLTQQVEKQGTTAAATLTQVTRQLWQLWQSFTAEDWWNDDLVNGTAAKSVMLMTTALRQTRLTQRSFTTSVLRGVNVTPPRSLPALSTAYPRSGVDPLTVYTRPAKQYQYAFSQGQPFGEARDVAQTRVADLAQMDLLKARMDESKTVLDVVPQVVGRRRVIHPELSKSGTCGLCVVAASRFYKKADLAPLHQHCECTEVAITEKLDPGLKLNQSDLDQIYKAAGSTSAADLLNTRVTIRTNGELGPILTKQGDHFRTAAASGSAPFRKAPLTPREHADALSNQIDDVGAKLALAQKDLAALSESDRQSPTGTAMFRAVKNLKDYQSALNVELVSASRKAA